MEDRKDEVSLVDIDTVIYVSPDGMATTDYSGYSYDITEQFDSIPDVAIPLLRRAKRNIKKIEQLLYDSPAFINLIKASIPKQAFQAILTDEQNKKLVSGAIKLMTKKDGTLMANLVNPKTNKIVSTVSLQSVNLSPAITQAMAMYSTQMQMAQIAEEIQSVQIAIEEVRQGQEFDRLATAYSCQQKLLQAMEIKNPELRTEVLLRITMDAEDSRNLLMQSQYMNVTFIKNQPESFWGKLISGATPEKISIRMNEIRESLGAINLVSLIEAIAYQELGEEHAARKSLDYFATYIKKTYLDVNGLVERLDQIDPSPDNYWSKTIPDIHRRIMKLPGTRTELLTGGDEDEDGDGDEPDVL